MADEVRWGPRVRVELIGAARRDRPLVSGDMSQSSRWCFTGLGGMDGGVRGWFSAGAQCWSDE